MLTATQSHNNMWYFYIYLFILFDVGLKKGWHHLQIRLSKTLLLIIALNFKKKDKMKYYPIFLKESLEITLICLVMFQGSVLFDPLVILKYLIGKTLWSVKK